MEINEDFASVYSKTVKSVRNNYHDDAESSKRNVAEMNAVIEADATTQEKTMRAVESDIQRQVSVGVEDPLRGSILCAFPVVH